MSEAEGRRAGDAAERDPVARAAAESTSASARLPVDGPAADETCDYCGSTSLSWRKCKLICGNCAQINKSCADL